MNHRIHPDRRHRLHLALLAGLAAHTHAVGQAASSGSSPDSASSVALATTGITTADVTSLDAVTVTGTASPAAEAKGLLDRIAGTASVVDRREVERGRSANAEDVLAYQPGVYAAATSGNSANKISIRGSGLNTFYQGYSLGLNYLYDGLPITGPGGTQEDLLVSDGVSHTEILNGANAFRYGATSLGGAINHVTLDGRTAPGAYLRLEGGSYGYRRAQASLGGEGDRSDYYVSVVANERDGFQDNTPTEGRAAVANFGYVVNERIRTRFIGRYREEDLHNGSTLSRDKIRRSPRLNRAPSARRKDGTTFLLNRTMVALDDASRLELGLAYNDYPLHNGWIYSPTPQDWKSTDTTFSAAYVREGGLLLGRPSESYLSFNHTRLRGWVTGWNRQPDGSLTERQFTRYTGSRNTVLSALNELEVASGSWLTTGLAAANIDRHVAIERTVLPDDASTNPLGYGRTVSYTEWYVLPRIGFRHVLAPDVQLFGNITRAVDPPVTWQIGSTGSPFARPLEPQKATTAEIGVRGRRGALEGSLAVYRSWIDDELLTIRVSPDPNVLPLNANASPTIHQGVEAALQARLWEDAAGNNLLLRQSYTFNDFYYEGDPEFGGNELPGIPRHFYQAELQLNRSSGFYAGVNVRAASSYYADFANTLEAESYAIVGARLGYEAPSQRWSVFVDLRNLTDERYAAASNTVFDARTFPLDPVSGHSTAPQFYPGDGRSGVAGISLRW